MIAADPKSAEIIRPILRGRDIKRYGYEFADLWLISTFPSMKYNINDYPAVRDYLLSFGINRLEQTGKTYVVDGVEINARKKTNNKWFETQDSIRYWDEFSKQKIVWARLMRISKNDNANFPRFALIDEDYYVQDSLCLLTGDKLPLICAVLNSDMGIFHYFTKIATLDDGGLQMRQQYIEVFPIPMPDSNDAVQEEILSLLNTQNDLNDHDFRVQMNQLVFRLYDLTENEIAYIKKLITARFDAINSR